MSPSACVSFTMCVCMWPQVLRQAFLRPYLEQVARIEHLDLDKELSPTPVDYHPQQRKSISTPSAAAAAASSAAPQAPSQPVPAPVPAPPAQPQVHKEGMCGRHGDVWCLCVATGVAAAPAELVVISQPQAEPINHTNQLGNSTKKGEAKDVCDIVGAG